MNDCIYDKITGVATAMPCKTALRPLLAGAVKERRAKNICKKSAPPPQPTPPATTRPVHGGELLKKGPGAKFGITSLGDTKRFGL
jgi:hypothetical protein